MTQLIDSTAADVDAAASAAHAASPFWASSDAGTRAKLLRGLAEALEGQRERLVALANAETHLGPTRLNGELDRTAFQLRGFATLVEQGVAFAATDDAAVPGAPPVGHPHLLRVRLPLGPVAMFSASNFPFAFSVLGGDTASALAAGCPVVVKAHRGHRALSHAVAELASQVVKSQGVPAGAFSMVDGRGTDVGVRLLTHPAIQAGAFTGSVRGGLALEKVAQTRKRPIPFFGELGSINPVVVLPTALAEKGAELAKGLAGSITMGCGQFCTSPGVILVPQGADGDAFVVTLVDALKAAPTHAMLTEQMRAGFESGRAAWAAHAALRSLLADTAAANEPPRPYLAEAAAATFIADESLHEEVFGPAALVVRVESTAQAIAALEAVGGTLTVTIWGANEANESNMSLVRAASQVAGRVLFAGFPTGVAVTAGQQHGGPFPSSTQASSTSVGWAAMDRFLRPVALQDAPAWLRDRAGRPC
jgi:acyl-CoA reductase-like NAD-dependent aldehyde dehydrogenase